MERAGTDDASHNNVGGLMPVQGTAAQNSDPASLVPPYWSHRRYESYCSVKNTKPAPITLEDHTGEQSPESIWAWAKGVSINDYVLVTGSVPNLGKFVVWSCRIETLDVSNPLVTGE